jgi:GNAT superfamily N-acetyltransferase
MAYENILALKNTDLKDQMLDDFVALSLAPLPDTYPANPDFIISLCAESIAAIEHGVATLFVIRAENKTLSAACVLDPFSVEDGCYHIHHISTFKSYQKKGLGKALIKEVVRSAGKFPVTLESSGKTVAFFEKLGFKSFENLTATGLYPMYNSSPEKNQFKKITVNGDLKVTYQNRALAALKKFKIIN